VRLTIFVGRVRWRGSPHRAHNFRPDSALARLREIRKSICTARADRRRPLEVTMSFGMLRSTDWGHRPAEDLIHDPKFRAGCCQNSRSQSGAGIPNRINPRMPSPSRNCCRSATLVLIRPFSLRTSVFSGATVFIFVRVGASMLSMARARPRRCCSLPASQTLIRFFDICKQPRILDAARQIGTSSACGPTPPRSHPLILEN